MKGYFVKGIRYCARANVNHFQLLVNISFQGLEKQQGNYIFIKNDKSTKEQKDISILLFQRISQQQWIGTNYSILKKSIQL